MKASNLITKEICGWKSSFEDLSSKKGKSYFNGIALRNIFTKYDILTVTEKDIMDELDLVMKGEIFGTKDEAELNKSLLSQKILRYQEWENRFSKKPKFRKADKVSIFISGNEITVDYHFIKVDDINKTITVCKVKNKKNPLKKSGRTEFTSIAKNKELFLLFSVGKFLYPTYESFGSLIFLSHEKDGTEEISSHFEIHDGENIVVRTYDDLDVNKMEDNIVKIIKKSAKGCNKNSECSSCAYANLCEYSHTDFSKLKVIPPHAKASGKVTFTFDQQKFIEVNKGVYRVLAGAGSGKTTVISNNVVQLLKNGVLPQDILLITYTTKGVQEIKEKISYWISKNHLTVDIDKLNIFTFNSFGHDIIKKEYKSLGYTKEPEVIDKVTQIEILKEILDSSPHLKGFNYVHPFMDLAYSKGVVIKISSIFSEIKRLGLTLIEEVEDEFGYERTTSKEILLMYKKYNEILKDKNLIEFNDQVPMAYELLSQKAILEKYGFGHIICDEFQDSDMLQINLLYLLYSYKYATSLCVCGDDSQTIFTWRGANQSNIVNFEVYFPEVKDIKMVENFRSTNEICALANYIDGLNANSLHKNISSDKSGSKPLLITGDLRTIIDLVKKDIDSGCKPEDIAILSRTKKPLIESRNALDELGIPSVIAVSELLIDNPKIKNLIGFSNFLLDETLDLHLAEYLQVAKYEEFMKAKASDLKKFVDKEKGLFMAEYSKCKTNKEQLEFFYKLVEDIAKTDKAVKKLLSHIFDKGFATMNSLVSYLNNLILFKADFFCEKSEDMYEAVTLTTIHSAKGKEYKKVYLDLSGFKYDKDLDETHRLLFVGVTRAKEELTIVGSMSNYFFKEIQDYFKLKKAV